METVQHYLLHCQLYEEERYILITDLENSWVHVSTHQMFTPYLGMTDTDIHLERTVGQFTERIARFKLAQDQKFASQIDFPNFFLEKLSETYQRE